uniref:YDG domain-containing protein n=1 Tax=Rubrivivax sp. JA1026 TaxID=2710888 RepID=UPI0013E98436
MNHGPGALNRIYRLVWNDSTGACVAVAEGTRSRGKRSRGVAGVVLGAGLVLGQTAAWAAPPAANALPQGGQVVSGQAALQQQGARLDITQASQRAAINWLSFDVGSQALVQIQQPNAQAVLLNRVTGADPSAIHGRLSANGQVLLVNPNGIVFGRGSRVDVGGLVASTLDIADADFAAGRLKFTRGDGAGSVVNQGTINTAAGGYAALLAPEVINEGVVSARLGTVALAAGDAVTLDVAGSELLGVKVDPATVAALVENRQLVQAEGGRVILSAGAAQRLREQAVAGGGGATDMLVAADGAVRLVGNTGSIVAQGGQVTLSGGNVDLGGSVAARDGGRLLVQADYVGQSGTLDVSSAKGAGGAVQIQADTVIQTAQARVTADGATRGGSIAVTGSTGAEADSSVYSSATFSARGGNGAGGDIAVTAASVQLRAATLDASGAQGGRVRVGGGFQGGDITLGNATTVGVNASTVLRADAAGAHGNGGQVVVWSDDKTLFAGRISARGGSFGGAGGQAEVSGKQDLAFQGLADLSSRDGRSGRLLLDPRNLIVDNLGSALASLSMSDPTPDATNGFGSSTQVLRNGRVVVTAPGADTGAVNDTGAVYLFDSSTGALLSNLRGSHAGDKVGSGGVTVLSNDNYLVRSPEYGTVTGVTVTNFLSDEGTGTRTAPTAPNYYALQTGTSASAGAITWQSKSGSGSSLVSASNSLVGDTSNTDSMVPHGYSGLTVTNPAAVTVTANDRLGGADVLSGTKVARPGTRIVELADGNVAIAAPTWFNGRGAVVWMDGDTGALSTGAAGATVSASTALVGSTPNRTLAPVSTATDGTKVYVVGADELNSTGTNELTRLGASAYYNYTDANQNRRTTPPGAAGDMVGSLLTVLPGGAYVVNSPLWSNGSAVYAGAVTYGAAGGGSVGAVGGANSLVGSSAYDFVGSGGVAKVGSSSQNYVVVSPYWSGNGNAAAGRFLENDPNGAVTWVDGSNGQPFGAGTRGVAVGAGNSLVGAAGDGLGAYSNIESALYTSYEYNSTTYASSFQTALRTTVSLTDGLRVLANGNYLAVDTSWNGTRGAVTFGSGDSGVAGTVSAANSLVGSTVGDNVGKTVTELSDSHYVVASPTWSNGATAQVGGVTWGSGTAGVSGALSSSNSLIGSGAYDQVGVGGVLAVGDADSNGRRANYIVLSPQWGNRGGNERTTVAYGAVTWGSGSGGVAGTVSAGNSLVGNSAGDYVGSYHYGDNRSYDSANSFFATDGTTFVMASPTAWAANLAATVDVLDDGSYVVRSPSWGGGKGAVTWGSGSAGVSGTVDSSNSLVGSTADGYTTVTTSDGSRSFYDINGILRSATFSRDTTYLTTTGDHVGLLGQALSGGRYMAVSPSWGNGRGALSMVGAGTVGTVGVANSVVGSTPDVYTDANHTTLVSAGDRLGTLPSLSLVTVPYTSTGSAAGTTYVIGDSTSRQVGLYYMNHTVTTGTPSNTTYKGSTGFTYNALSDWYLTAFTLNMYPLVKELSNGAVLVGSAGWNNGSALNAGAVTWFSASGQLSDGSSGGTLSDVNSVVGSHTRDWLGYRLPVDGVIELNGPNAGNFVLVNSQWWDGRGAVTWGSGTSGAAGTVSAANSLVGSKADTRPATTLVARAVYNNGTGVAYNTWAVRDNTTGQTAGAVTRDGDRIGQGGVYALADGNVAISSPFWDHSNASYTNNVYLGYGAPKSKGAVTWMNGGSGQLFGGDAGGTVSAANSLVGSSYGDAVSWAVWEQGSPSLTASFLMPGVTALPDGAYVVASPYWANGAATAAGAVTHVSAGGMAGAVGTGNSLVGSTANDHVGLSTGIRVGATGTNRKVISGVTVVNVWNPLANAYETNYFVRSPDWANLADPTGGLRAGALTWVDGSTGLAAGENSRGAVVSVTNSLVGSTAGDKVGSHLSLVSGTVGGNRVTTGDLLMFSNIADCDIPGVGAITLISGLTGATGPVGWRNSVVGLAPTADGLNTSSFSGGTNLQNYVSDVQYALLPTAVTASETVAYRPLVWAAPNATSGKNASQVMALTLVADDLAQPRNADQINGNAGNLNWGSAGFAGDAAGFGALGGSGGLLGFSASLGADVVLTPATLTAMLDAGTDVTLQASRDITVVRDLIVSAGGLGGDLTLEAGRSILLYGHVQTDNGDFTAIANQNLSAGVVANDCPSCSASLTMAPGSRIDTGTGALSLRLLDSDKASDVAGAITVSQLAGRSISVVNQGLNASSQGMGIRFTSGSSVGDADTEAVELAAGGNSGVTNGGIVLAADTTINGASNAELKVRASSASTDLSLGGSVLGGAALTLSAAQIGAILKQSSGFDVIQFGSNDQGGVTTLGALDFTQASMLRGASTLDANLRLSGGGGGILVGSTLKSGAADGRQLELFTYDGTITLGASSAITASTGDLRFSSFGGGVTQASGSTINAAAMRFGGDATAVLTAGDNTIGNLAGNFGSLDIKTTSSTTVHADGLAADHGLRLQASGASSDITLAGTVANGSGDLVLAAGRHFVNNTAVDTGLDAGTGRYLVYSTSPSGTTEGMTGYDKHYAQSYSAGSTPAYAASGDWFLYSVSPTLTVSAGSGSSVVYGSGASTPAVSITGFIDDDTVASATTGSLDTSLSSYTASGAGYIPVGSYTLALNGQGTFTSSLGYTISVTTGSSTLTVTPKAINVSGLSANDKVYDGTTATTVSGTAAIVGGGSVSGDGRYLSNDVVSLSGTASGAFADRHVGDNKSVTLSGLTLGGADAGNYTISTDSVTADITPKTLTVSGLSVASSKVYDGSTTATVSGSGSLLAAQAAGSGSTGDGRAYSGDTISLSGTATGSYNDATVAGASTVSFGGLTLSGAEAGNYVLALGSQAATITPKALTVTGLTAQNKVYDATTTASFGGTAALSGVVGSDAVSLTGTLAASFGTADAGTNKSITTSGLSLTGAAAGNYSLTALTAQADITARTLDVTALDRSKTYGDADPTLGFSVGGLGLVGGDSAADVFAGLLNTVTGASATAGTHAITQGTLAVADGNYQLGTFTAGTLTVAKAQL